MHPRSGSRKPPLTKEPGGGEPRHPDFRGSLAGRKPSVAALRRLDALSRDRGCTLPDGFQGRASWAGVAPACFSARTCGQVLPTPRSCGCLQLPPSKCLPCLISTCSLQVQWRGEGVPPAPLRAPLASVGRVRGGGRLRPPARIPAFQPSEGSGRGGSPRRNRSNPTAPRALAWPLEPGGGDP